MKFISLPIYFNKKQYQMNSFFGILFEFENAQNKKIITPKKITDAIGYCNNPYTLTNIDFREINNIQNIKKNTLRFYSNLLININKLNFGLGRFCSSFGQPVFNNASTSISFFRNYKPGAIQNDLCLPRSLFAASTSKIFKEKGVIFIGVSLPSNLMHAWIIEDGKQPDPSDTMWINFQPVAAIY
jgi:hypothetical protein